MRNGHRFWAFAAAVTAAIFFCVATSWAVTSKEFEPDPKTIKRPDLDKDPGFYFLMGEHSEAVGDTEGVLNYFRKALELDPTSAYLNTRIGTLLARSRKIADALIIARSAVLFDPKYDEAYSLLGKIYSVTGDRRRAVEAYNSALDLKPDERDLYIFLGSLQASQKLYPDAEKTFTRMIEQFPQEKEGYFYLGKVLVEEKRYDKAVEIFTKLLEARGDNQAQAHMELGNVYVLQEKYPEAEKHFREAVKLDPFNINGRLSLGQVLAAQKKYDELDQVFTELSKLAPSNLVIQIKMALILAEQKQFDKARQMLDKILESKPGWDQVRFHLGRILREQGKTDEAEKEFVQIQKGQPTFTNSRIMLAIMFLKKKDYAKAVRYVEEAIEPDMKDADVFHIKGSILEELNRYDEAAEMYQKALELDPTNTRIRYSLGNVYEKGGRRSMGLAEMEKILAQKPDDASALNFIGYTLAMSGADIDRAERLVRKANEIKPDDGYIMDSLAWILHTKGENDAAMEYLQKAAGKVKNDPIVQDHLGEILEIKNREEEAADAYRRSLTLNPDNLLVQDKLRKLEQELGQQKK